MGSCTHAISGKDDRVWIEKEDKYSEIEKHLWCTKCGQVQNKSDDRPKAIGFWMNKLSLIAYELNLTQCQKRLIAKDIQSNEYLNDTFSAFGSSQKKLFNRIVSQYTDTSSIDFDLFIQL